MRSYFVPAIAFVLCACASTAPGDMAPAVQNAVYVVGEGTPQTQPVTTSDMQSSDGMQQPSKLMKLYYFFAGR